MLPKFDKIFFDLDGTLSNSYRGIENGIRFALAKIGIKDVIEKDIKKLIGLPLYESFNKYYFNNTEKTWEAIGFFRQYYHKKGIFESELYPGIIQLLIELNKLPKLYVITAKPTLYAKKLLEYHNVAYLFTDIVGSQMDGGVFSKSALIKEVGENNNSIMVGDKSEDVMAGKETGIKTCGVLYGYGTHREILDAEPDYIIGTVQELKKVLIG